MAGSLIMASTLRHHLCLHSLEAVLTHSTNSNSSRHESVETFLAVRWLMDGRTQVALHQTKEIGVLGPPALEIVATRLTRCI